MQRRARDGHLLLHAARESHHGLSPPLPEPHEPQVPLGLRPRDRGLEAVERGVEDQVVPGRLALVEARLLSEDPDGRADLRIVPAEAKPGDLRGPGARRDKGAEQPQGRCFAGAVGSEEAEDLALVHVEIDAVNRGEGAEPLGQFLRADDALHSGSESISRIH